MKRPVYLCIETKAFDISSLQCLSTKVMQWSEGFWVADLTPYMHFWRRKAEISGLSVSAVISKVLSEVFAGEVQHKGVATITPSYRAVVAENPWRAILLLTYMKERNLKGLLKTEHGFGQKLFSDISWKSFWECVDRLGHHLGAQKTKGFKTPVFNAQKGFLSRSIKRLSFEKFAELAALNHNGFKKRYGKWLANVWLWSFEQNENGKDYFEQTFPWKFHVFSECPKVSRCLDFPLYLWDQLAPILKEDCERVAKLATSKDRITKLEWSIKLDDMSEIVIPIRFRNPHNLSSDGEEHTTTLLQARYSFEADALEKLPQTAKKRQEDPSQVFPLVVGWQLAIVDRLQLPQGLIDLFGEWEGENDELNELLQLENELPVALNKFSYAADWYPEHSFKTIQMDEQSFDDTDFIESFTAASFDRPLLLCEPKILDENTKVQTSEFLESVSGKWWEKGLEGERDYYRIIDTKGYAYWAYLTKTGNWMVHGIFG